MTLVTVGRDLNATELRRFKAIVKKEFGIEVEIVKSGPESTVKSTKRNILKEIKEGVLHAKKISEGKVKPKSLDSFLNEI